MKKSIKAALLSGLVFPGSGHMFLQQYRRGSVLLLSAIAALSVIIAKALNQALIIADKINSGEISVEAATIAELASIPTRGAEDLTLNFAALIFGAVWLIGIVDSYRLGIIQEK
ncbi:MAG: hypothetical protein QGH93_00505 [Gammaproteobacteria bacterium]|jgi:hypothetical protein|nr:hypothetical protein [Chromatiales bacterium]MDP6673319.1 hypothetical protein [Gammaproteobacteria bacterium]